MDKRSTDRMQKRLLSLKVEILDHLAQEDEMFREIWEAVDPKDEPDIASDDIDRTTLEALGAQETRRLNLIESALARIPNGHYGVCMKCSENIPKERLQAIPYALLCINCQSGEERKFR
jgi:DnaK suppressor protein